MKLRNLIPIILAAIAALLAFFLLRGTQEKTVPVVLAAVDLSAGHKLVATDLTVKQVPESQVTQNVITDPKVLVGQTLQVDRFAGDPIGPNHVGGQAFELAPNERALAVTVTDSAGLAGLLKPGDRVGITAVLSNNQGAYAKMVAENLRVLYISPEFKALDPQAYDPNYAASAEDESAFSNNSRNNRRQPQGVVVLAVPIDVQVIAYDFSMFGVESETRMVNIVDLLPALDHARNVELSLFVEPTDADPLLTSGVYVPDLVVMPAPSPTPTPTPIGAESIEATPESESGDEPETGG